MIVYLAINRQNGKCYIGKTIETLEQRWCKHKWEARKGRSQLIFHKAIRKYGADTFELTELCYAPNHDSLYACEQFCISAFKAANIPLYNCTDGGPGSYGLKHSLETKAKQRLAKLGTKQKPEAIAKRVLAVKARYKHTPRKANPPISLETRAKLSAANKGNPKCIASHLGKKATEETRRKISAALKAYRSKNPNAFIPKHNKPPTILGQIN